MLTGPSSVISLIAEVYMLYIFAILSRKLGNVTKMKPYYRGFYGAIALIVVAIVAHSIRIGSMLSPNLAPAALTSDGIYLLVFYLPMALAAAISLGVAWRYWSWLFRERM